MASPFPPWSDTAFRAALFAAAMGALCVVVLPMIYVRTPYRRGQFDPLDQPVEFDHRHHVRDDGIDCRYCHSTVDRAASAGIPSTDVCMGCHSQIWNESSITEPVRRSYFAGTPIPWNRVHDLPDFVYFNHAIHVTGGIGCVTCHGAVDEMARVYQVAPLTMSWCVDCHRHPESMRSSLDAAADADRPDHTAPEAPRAEAAVGPTHCTACHR